MMASDVSYMNARLSPMDTVDDICPLTAADVVAKPDKFAEDMAHFSWNRIGHKTGRRQIEGALEEFYDQHNSSLFPVDEVPIWGASDESIGTLLFVAPHISTSTPASPKELSEMVQQLQKECTPRAKVVLNIVQAVSLVPNSGMADPHTYIRATMGKDIIEDKHKRIGCDPIYSTRMVFDHCQFPNDSTLKIEVMEAPNEWCGFLGIENETVVGETLVNLEQRWRSKWFRELMDTGNQVVEMRTLQTGGMTKGYLAMWVEILTKERPMDPLPSPEPIFCTIRLAIYNVSKIAFVDKDGTLDCQIEAKMTGNDKVTVSKSTDVHCGVNQKDMKATFNWRLVFCAPWPMMDPTLKIVLWDARTIGGIIPIGREPLAECALNLEFDLKDAAEKKQSVVLAMDSLHMTRTREAGKTRALLQCELAIVPEHIATVGEGREEPNQNPFLDPLDPHLQKGRPDLIADILGTVQKIGSTTLFWVKWGTAIYMLGSVVGMIVTAVVAVVVANNFR